MRIVTFEHFWQYLGWRSVLVAVLDELLSDALPDRRPGAFWQRVFNNQSESQVEGIITNWNSVP